MWRGGTSESEHRESYIAYDDADNATLVVDAANAETSYEYDNRGHLRKIVHPDLDGLVGMYGDEQRSEQRTYDRAGNLETITLPFVPGVDTPVALLSGSSTTTRIAWSIGASQPGSSEERTSFQYDLAGNLIKETQPEAQPGRKFVDKSRIYTPDALNSDWQHHDEAELVTNYEYDGNDNLRFVRGPGTGSWWSISTMKSIG